MFSNDKGFCHGSQSVDDYETRSSDRVLGHLVCVGEGSNAFSDSRNSKAVHLVLIIREKCLGSYAAIGLREDVQGFDDWEVLLVDVGDPQLISVVEARVFENNGDLLRLGTRRCGNGQGLECLQWDVLDVGTAARDDKVLDGSEREVQITGCQEGKLAWDLALENAIPALLLALLPDDRGNLPRETDVFTNGESLHDVLQRAQNQVREGGSQNNGGLKVRDGELVPAGLNLVDAKVAQGAVCVERMKLLLLWALSV